VTFNPIVMPQVGWSCPKCGKVYAPHCNECWACNSPLLNPPGAPPYPAPGWPQVICSDNTKEPSQ
jgi:hypothetical protein